MTVTHIPIDHFETRRPLQEVLPSTLVQRIHKQALLHCNVQPQSKMNISHPVTVHFDL